MNESQVFANAMSLADPADRAAYLDAACAGDPELRAAVEALLQARDSDPDFLEQPPGTADLTAPGSPTVTMEASGPEKPGAILAGRYKLLEVVGEGGMGTVWMAEQQQPVRRRVAVKLIKPGMDSKAVLARFEAERQAIALMDHPNIAKVHDAGATPDGRPFFVMELVKGVPITRFCDDHRLTPKDRLELFVPVCHAIQHAHQKGVIHRDVKPSNVLVAHYDDRPVPKVIDFGVAKATEQQLTDRTLHTGFGTVVGTVEYMSPEQATFNQLDIDTRSDIYSLGVLLYELLAGSPPFTAEDLERAGALEMLRVIREVEPARPSARLSTADGLPTLAANRGTEPKRLTRIVRGELDWIVMKALEKDRSRRYETANGFAQDVQRYLADESVLACPPSAGYRVRKFARRNKGPVLAVSLILLALFGGGIGAAFGLIENRKQREMRTLWQQAERDRRAAEVARGEAELARDGETKAKQEAEDAREMLAYVEYGRTMQVAQQEWFSNNVASTLALIESTRRDLRGWEWRYVHRLCYSDLLTLKGHTKAVNTVSFSADGCRIVTASKDGTAKVWDATSGAVLLTLSGPGGIVLSASFSADGSRIVTGNWDNTATVWNASTGAPLLPLKGHIGRVPSASFNADGSRIVTASYDKTAKVWDATNGADLRTLRGHTDAVISAAFSPDGSRVVTASADHTAKVWDATTGADLRTLQGHTQGLWSASFSPDGSRIVTASADNTAKVWDATTGADLLTHKGHFNSVFSASFRADGSRIVTGGNDNRAFVWDATTGHVFLVLRGHTATVTSASFRADGARIVTGSRDQTAKVWDATSRSPVLFLIGHAQSVHSAAWSADGSRIVTGSSDKTAKVWDAATRAVLRTLRGHTNHVTSAAFNPDGVRIVTGSSDRTAKVWDATSGAELRTHRGHTHHVNSVSFSPDGSRIVTGSSDTTAKVWDAMTGAELHTLRGHTQGLRSASFSPDGSWIVTGSADSTAKVWDATSGAELRTLRGHTDGLWSASFSPDGSRVVTGSHDKTVKVWDATNGAELRTLRGHTDQVTSVSINSDGSRIVTGSSDKTAKIWDARSGAELLSLHADCPVWSVAWSADGSRIVAGRADTAANVWDARPVSREFLPIVPTTPHGAGK